MTEGLLKRLLPPDGMVDVVLDTDAYNEIDDQFAIAYLIRSTEKLHLQALYAAPFFNENSNGPADGMERSYHEILNLLGLMGCSQYVPVTFRGSENYLPNEKTPVFSDAVRDLAKRAMEYSPEHPLYVVSIGAITNIASALLLEPCIADRIVIIWLGGHSLEWPNTAEFNMMQDIAAARVVFGCGAAVVQLPCMGVVSHFSVSKPELLCWLAGKNPLCDYLVSHTVEQAEENTKHSCWSRVIWDVTAVAWLLNGSNGAAFMRDRLIASPIPQYDHHYSFDPGRHPSRYVYHIERDALLDDLVKKLTGPKDRAIES